MWNFKGTLWNSTINILPIHWKILVLYNIEILKALRFESSYTFFKHPPEVHIQSEPSQYTAVHRITVFEPLKNNKTRSTLRMQTSATSSLGMSNSLVRYETVSKIGPIVPCAMTDLSLKFPKNMFICFSMMLLIAMNHPHLNHCIPKTINNKDNNYDMQ